MKVRIFYVLIIVLFLSMNATAQIGFTQRHEISLGPVGGYSIKDQIYQIGGSVCGQGQVEVGLAYMKSKKHEEVGDGFSGGASMLLNKLKYEQNVYFTLDGGYYKFKNSDGVIRGGISLYVTDRKGLGKIRTGLSFSLVAHKIMGEKNPDIDKEIKLGFGINFHMGFQGRQSEIIFVVPGFSFLEEEFTAHLNIGIFFNFDSRSEFQDYKR
ncbi:MAG: hypothetical protein ABIJ45_13045 [Candidatus Zixiibacteriota bacterium]